ncbi:MAG: hypothetical protein SGJ09_06960 [Phycisphaerae bacterium]|nr:hypothetical protein [Phycisphaerae bacterium]
MMGGLSASALVDAWERGILGGPGERALIALEEAGASDPAALGVAERDRLLAHLRALTFGDAIDAVIECPACAAQMTFELSCTELIRASGTEARAPTPTVDLLREDLLVALRLPTAGDLAATATAADVRTAERAILARCAKLTDGVGARHDLERLSAESIDELAGEFDRLIAAEAPLSLSTLSLRCPSCEHAWEAPLDFGEFLWTEIDAEARRLLGDVHVLASAYGWSEREILALRPLRRDAYLRQCAGDAP